MQLPPDEIMRLMAKMAMEQAAEFFAKMAERFADEMKAEPQISSADALLAFAAAIRETNAKQYPLPNTQRD